MGSSVFNDKKMKIMWDNRYNLGVEEIDKEHQRLFAIIRKIVGLVENGEERKAQHACREGVKFFKNYTIIHFAHEENFMSSLNYGGYERHKKIHDDLKKTASAFFCSRTSYILKNEGPGKSSLPSSLFLFQNAALCQCESKSQTASFPCPHIGTNP